MVVVWLIDCLTSMGGLVAKSEGNASSVAFGREMLLAGVDCMIIAGRSLWEPLGQGKIQSEKAPR